METGNRKETALTINRQAGGGLHSAVWICVELAGVARLVLRLHLLDGQLGVGQASAQTNPTHELIRHALVAVLGVGGHGGGVALFGRLPPQHLLDPLGEAVPAGEGGGVPAHGRLVAIQVHFTWGKGKAAVMKMKTQCGLTCVQKLWKEKESQKCVCACLIVTTGSAKGSRVGGLSLSLLLVWDLNQRNLLPVS